MLVRSAPSPGPWLATRVWVSTVLVLWEGVLISTVASQQTGCRFESPGGQTPKLWGSDAQIGFFFFLAIMHMNPEMFKTLPIDLTYL